MKLKELQELLNEKNADYQLLEQNIPILSTIDAERFYDVKKAAPTFILQNEAGLLAFIVSANRGRLDFEQLKQQLGYSKLNMADRKSVAQQTGMKFGTIPLVGHGMPCMFDDSLLGYDYIYGGTGDELVTLKISPADVKRLNNIIATI